ncbi:MAG: hypothetical protein CK426_02740 [Legionella sp.]|nr:MAG: hypothetical protein CK423_08595 [Legionella sp.]PJD99449.1 MAG: hypothetical protein CK426_02740 [Legionella sp.]
MKKLGKMLFVTVIMTVFYSAMSWSGSPLWTIVSAPSYPSTVSVSSTGVATVKYRVTNQSHKTHTLILANTNQAVSMQVTDPEDCPDLINLRYQQSCLLNLYINGSQLHGSYRGGPVLCQQGSPLQCYQPGANDILNITYIPVGHYLITPTAEANGAISPATPTIVDAGANLTFTATPASGYQVDKWYVNDAIAQYSGTTFTLSNISQNYTVDVSFTLQGALYAGTESGLVYFSADNGLTWAATNTTPSTGYAVNGLYATQTTLWVASADGKVYFSTDNGSTWNASSALPGGVAANAIFVANNGGTSTWYVGTPYAGSSSNVVFTSIDNGISWSATTNPSSATVNSLFVDSSNTIYAGSEDGNVYYSQNNGSSWSTISGPESSVPVPVQNVFATNSQLYVNTRQLSSNGTLPPDTVNFEYAYVSNSLTNSNPVWTLFSQITYTLFVNTDASLIYAGTQGGYVYSLTTGDSLGLITNSPITSLFFLE